MILISVPAAIADIPGWWYIHLFEYICISEAENMNLTLIFTRLHMSLEYPTKKRKWLKHHILIISKK